MSTGIAESTVGVPGWMLACVLLLVLLATRVIAGMLARHGRRLALQDMPNARSSHTVPTPRGGGVAIVIAAFAGFAWLVAGSRTTVPASLWAALAGAAVMASTGFVDDLRNLGSGVRLAVQALAVVLLFHAVGWFTMIEQGLAQGLVPSTATGMVLAGALWLLALLGGVWWVNLFNFMDGTDGIATMQAIFMLAMAIVLSVIGGGAGVGVEAAVGAGSFTPGAGKALDTQRLVDWTMAWSAIVACACLGFLMINWAPARIFMGDAGSLFLGYSILCVGAISIATGRTRVDTWLLLGGTFIADATVTLLRRACLRINVTSAHRTHLYQRLARRLRSHRSVALIYFVVNLGLGCAAFASLRFPGWAGASIALLLLGALMAAAWRNGAGKPEAPDAPPTQGNAPPNPGNAPPSTPRPS